MEYKIMLYSDLHLRLSDPLGVPTSEGFNTRVEQKLNSLKKVIDYASENGCNELIDLGDLFDNINPPTKIRNAVARILKYAVVDKGMSYTRIAGNHETDGREVDGADLGILGDNINIITSIQKHSFIKNLVFIPEVQEDKISNELGDDSTLIIGHFEVKGSLYPNNRISESGVSVGDRKFPMYLGHIHLRQELNCVNYIGALCRQNFGDKNIPTGCCLLTLEIDDNSIVSYSHLFIEVEDISLKEYLYVEPEDNSYEFDVKEGDIVKLVCKGSREWFTCLDVSSKIKNIRQMGALKVIVDFTPTTTVEKDVADVGSFSNFDFKEMLEQYSFKSKEQYNVGLKYLLKAEELCDE